MSKICANCGATVEDGAEFCTSCNAEMNKPAEVYSQPQGNEYIQQPPQGNGYYQQPPQGNGYYQQPPQGNGYYQQPQGDMYAQQNYPPNNQAAPAPNPVVSFATKLFNDAKDFVNKLGKEKLIKYSIIGGSALVVIIVAIVIVVNLLFPSPKAVLQKGLDAVINGNAGQLVSVLPPFLFEMDEDMDKEDYIEQIEETFEDAETEDIKYEIKKIENASSSERRAIRTTLELYEDYLDDFDAKDVTEFKVAKVKMKDGGDTSTEEISLIKYKGRWYLWMPTFM